MTVSGDSSRYDHQRQQAIRAAARVFARKGYHGAATRDIAEELGIKQGSLYYYFSSKEEALEEVCLFGIADYVRRMEEIAVNDQPFSAKLLATVTSHMTAYREKNEALKVHNDERLYLPAERRVQLKGLGSRYRELLETIFVDALKSGRIRSGIDPHFAAQAVIGICNSWGDRIVREPDLDILSIANRCVDLLLNGFVINNAPSR